VVNGHIHIEDIPSRKHTRCACKHKSTSTFLPILIGMARVIACVGSRRVWRYVCTYICRRVWHYICTYKCMYIYTYIYTYYVINAHTQSCHVDAFVMSRHTYERFPRALAVGGSGLLATVHQGAAGRRRGTGGYRRDGGGS